MLLGRPFGRWSGATIPTSLPLAASSQGTAAAQPLLPRWNLSSKYFAE